jgi:hypothetical protein
LSADVFALDMLFARPYGFVMSGASVVVPTVCRAAFAAVNNAAERVLPRVAPFARFLRAAQIVPAFHLGLRGVPRVALYYRGVVVFDVFLRRLPRVFDAVWR